MPHIGLKVSNELYQHARLSAARRNMSVSLLLRNFLTTLDKTPIDGKEDSQSFDKYFPPQPEQGMSVEYLRLLHQIAKRKL
jgi:hypothetical protein